MNTAFPDRMADWEHVMAVDFWILSVMAEQGDAAAQFHLGAMHACGQGVPQDYAQAYTWFNAVAAHSNINAKTFRKLTGELIQD